MIEYKRKYKNLDDTLSNLRLQVLQSLDFAEKNCPEFNEPSELFDWLKSLTTYKNDPPGIELLQRMDTLINGKYWGHYGWGDCDCFTITVLACCEVLGWNSWIKLAGRTKDTPVHIWSGVKWKGKDIALDLTEPFIGQERDYKYIQKINFVPLRNYPNIAEGSTINNSRRMYLQLAENRDMCLSDQCGLPPINPSKVPGFKLLSAAKRTSLMNSYNQKLQEWQDCRSGKGKPTTFNPVQNIALSPGRAFFLLLLDYNVDGLASRLATEDTTALAKQWNQMGGDTQKLFKNINSGKGKSPRRVGFLDKFVGSTALADAPTSDPQNPSGVTAAQKSAIIGATTALGASIAALIPPAAPIALPGGAILGTVIVGILPFIKNAANKTPSSETAGANIPDIIIPLDPNSAPPAGGTPSSESWMDQTNFTGFTNKQSFIVGGNAAALITSAVLYKKKKKKAAIAVLGLTAAVDLAYYFSSRNS